MTDPEWRQLLQGIRSAEDAEGLRLIREDVHALMAGRLSHADMEQFYGELNAAHDAIIRRCVELAQKELARLGRVSPAVPFAYVLFGSGGRREQTLLSDQDSGIIYGDPPDEAGSADCRQYFEMLGQMTVQLLLGSGYPLCEGNVLGSNSDWCSPLAQWKQRLGDWFREPEWESVRYLLIVADSRCVYGDARLHGELMDQFYNDIVHMPTIIRRMLDNTMQHKMLLNVFGQLLREPYGEEAGSLDIKYGAYIPMVNAARLLAIEAGLRETSTLDRIRRLEEIGVVPRADAAQWIRAFMLFLKLRMMTTEKLQNGQFSTSGKLSPHKLTKDITEELKSGLKLGKKLQRLVYKHTVSRF